MQDRYIIYGLVDPRTLMIRYIGRSSSGLARPRQHARYTENCYCANWIKSLHDEGLRYTIAVLQVTDQALLNIEERWWIAYGRLSGWPLTNLTDGGESNYGWKVSEATRANMRAARAKYTGLNSPQKRPEVRALMRELKLGERNPMKRPEVRAKITGPRKKLGMP